MQGRESGGVLKDLDDKKGSLKSLIFSLPTSLSTKKAIYALTTKTLQHKSCIHDVIESYKLLKKEPKLIYHTALVIVYDVIFTKAFKARGPLTRAVLHHKNGLMEIFQAARSSENREDNKSSLMPHLPRYVRVNTLKSCVVDVVRELKGLGFTERSSLSEVESSEMSFCFDNLVPNLLAFSPSTKELGILTASSLYQSSQIILQDKSSCLPAHVLAPPPGSHVIDCCAAPGNKTSHTAALMDNTGIIYSYDRDKCRHDAMKRMLASASVTCVKTFNEDFLKVEPEVYRDVEYIIVDPSCSGSGMTRRLESKGSSKVTDKKRLKSLSRFQTMILKHALSFPSVKKLVYSTCSIHREENEDVVAEVLSQYHSIYQLEEILPHWTTRGITSSPVGSQCIRVSPTTDKAQGFFLALFQRKEDVL